MLETERIPKERWSSFLTLLYRQARDRPVRLEVMGRELGDQEMAERRPLHGLSYETKGSEAGSVSITVGSAESEAEIEHRIFAPTAIYVARSGGAIEWLSIEEGEVRTLLHFEELPALEMSEQPPAP